MLHEIQIYGHLYTLIAGRLFLKIKSPLPIKNLRYFT